jgi:hypothetical protein
MERLRDMYRSEGFAGGNAGFGRYHRLAEAIRRGCVLRPKKMKTYFWRGLDGACALGAAMVGAGKPLPKRNAYHEIVQVFPELMNVAAHPLDGGVPFHLSVGWIVCRLNADTEYSREAIADWLCVEGGCKHRVARPIVAVEDEAA